MGAQIDAVASDGQGGLQRLAQFGDLFAVHGEDGRIEAVVLKDGLQMGGEVGGHGLSRWLAARCGLMCSVKGYCQHDAGAWLLGMLDGLLLGR